MIEKHMSMSKAARLAGISNKTLKRWLHVDLGIEFPLVARGSCLVVREKDVEACLARRRDLRNVVRRYTKRNPGAA